MLRPVLLGLPSAVVPRHVVQRLSELSAHFARQPATLDRGSPFGPYFAKGGPELVPKLSKDLPLSKSNAGEAAAALPAGF